MNFEKTFFEKNLRRLFSFLSPLFTNQKSFWKQVKRIMKLNLFLCVQSALVYSLLAVHSENTTTEYEQPSTIEYEVEYEQPSTIEYEVEYEQPSNQPSTRIEPTSFFPTKGPTSKSPTVAPSSIPTLKPTYRPTIQILSSNHQRPQLLCQPAYGLNRNQCNRLIRFCRQIGKPMKWTGAGCKGVHGDGGCQCNKYCGYVCKETCNRDSSCKFQNGQCIVKETGLPGEPILLC
jgi:hypothetical protein